MALAAIGNAATGTKNSLLAAQRAANPFASVLASAADSVQKATGNNPVEQDQVNAQQDYNKQLDALQQQLAGLLSDAGVDMSHDVRLELNSEGKAVLSGDHPNQAQIDDVLKAHPELSSKLKSLADLYRKIHQPPAESVQPVDPQAKFAVTLAGGQITASLGS